MIRNILEFIGVFNEHNSKIAFLEKCLIEQMNESRDVINELETKKNAAEAQIKELLADKTVDVQALMMWYEERFGENPWFYSYDGRMAKDVKCALEVPERAKGIIRDTSKKVIDATHLKESPNPLDIISSVKRFFTYRGEWTYVTDMEMHGVQEFWAPAHTSAESRRGDCDSLAILMHRLILDMFDMYGFNEYGWRLKLAVGRVIGEGGHAYNIWLHDDGEWYVIESTYDLKGSFARTWLKTPIRNNNMYVDFWGFARPDRSWRGNGLDSLETNEVN